MDGVSSDYTSMYYKGKQVNITAQYPLRQMSWLTEFVKRSKYTGGNDTTDVWNGMSINDITETWLGSSARTGTGNVFLQERGKSGVHGVQVGRGQKEARAKRGSMGVCPPGRWRGARGGARGARGMARGLAALTFSMGAHSTE